MEDTKKKQVPEKHESVVKGEVKVKDQSLWTKIKNSFRPADIKDAKGYYLDNYIIPAGKRYIRDMLVSAIDMYFGKGSGKMFRSIYDDATSRTAKIHYDDAYNQQDTRREPAIQQAYTSRSPRGFSEIRFNDLGDAQLVLSQMDEVISRFGQVRVSEYYEFAGVTNQNWAIVNYGWTNLSSVHVVPTMDGRWIIDFPNPIPLNN